MLNASFKLLCLITWSPVKGTGNIVYLGDRESLEKVEDFSLGLCHCVDEDNKPPGEKALSTHVSVNNPCFLSK